jgi:hypothetical protein
MLVWSKKRRNNGPPGVQRLVTNLTEASTGAMLSLDAWRWGIEVTRKALKSGWHWSQRQGTTEAERVTCSVGAYLLLVQWDGHDEALTTA